MHLNAGKSLFPGAAGADGRPPWHCSSPLAAAKPGAAAPPYAMVTIDHQISMPGNAWECLGYTGYMDLPLSHTPNRNSGGEHRQICEKGLHLCWDICDRASGPRAICSGQGLREKGMAIGFETSKDFKHITFPLLRIKTSWAQRVIC